MFEKLKKWLNTKVGIENPFALTLEGWDEHEIESQKKGSIRVLD